MEYNPYTRICFEDVHEDTIIKGKGSPPDQNSGINTDEYNWEITNGCDRRLSSVLKSPRYKHKLYFYKLDKESEGSEFPFEIKGKVIEFSLDEILKEHLERHLCLLED